ncbi:MAG: D-alanyl-D-alanine carboxypeptidase family protein [Candidatus Fimenecus sp.]
MCKKCFWSIVLSVLFLCSFVLCAGAEGLPTDISAEACILMVADTHEVLFSRNEQKQLPMASTTKIMTALVALESGIPHKEITVTDEMVRVEGTSIGLLPGDSITVQTLVAGMLLESGNDAANVTAYAVAGGIAPFVEMMNAKARELGMQNTCFETVSGLDSENHHSTAYDMALLGCAAIQNPVFRSICSQTHMRVSYGNPPYMRTFSNHNKLLSAYDGAFGIKTGFTKKSGRCLVSAAERDGITLVAVTLNAPNDWADHEKLFDYGFSVVQKKQAFSLEQCPRISVVGGVASAVSTTIAGDCTVVLGDSQAQVTAKAYVQPFLYAPVQAGDCVGSIDVFVNGEKVFTRTIVAAENVAILASAGDSTAEKGQNHTTLSEKFKAFFNMFR